MNHARPYMCLYVVATIVCSEIVEDYHYYSTKMYSEKKKIDLTVM